MIKVMIIDDHHLAREGLKKIVEEYAMDIKVILEAANAADVLQILSKRLPDILILDIGIPIRNGLDVLKDVKRLYPKLPVLMLSMHSEDRYATRAIKAGASGYLTKGSIATELIKAIRMIVVEKKKYISSNVAEQLAHLIDVSSEKPLHETLTDREYQVLCLIANGKSVNKIAEELSLSTQTIHTYRSHLKQKMNLKSNVDLTRYAIREQLVD